MKLNTFNSRKETEKARTAVLINNYVEVHGCHSSVCLSNIKHSFSAIHGEKLKIFFTVIPRRVFRKVGEEKVASAEV